VPKLSFRWRYFFPISQKDQITTWLSIVGDRSCTVSDLNWYCLAPLSSKMIRAIITRDFKKWSCLLFSFSHTEELMECQIAIPSPSTKASLLWSHLPTPIDYSDCVRKIQIPRRWRLQPDLQLSADWYPSLSRMARQTVSQPVQIPTLPSWDDEHDSNSRPYSTMTRIVMWRKLHSRLWLPVHSSPLADAINTNHNWDFSGGEESLMWDTSWKVAALPSLG
jgi:hypothetical protein